jgi:hypothetical protein
MLLCSPALECNLMHCAAPTLDSAREAIVVPSLVHPEHGKLAVQEINSLLDSEQKISFKKRNEHFRDLFIAWQTKTDKKFMFKQLFKLLKLWHKTKIEPAT